MIQYDSNPPVFFADCIVAGFDISSEVVYFDVCVETFHGTLPLVLLVIKTGQVGNVAEFLVAG